VAVGEEPVNCTVHTVQYTYTEARASWCGTRYGSECQLCGAGLLVSPFYHRSGKGNERSKSDPHGRRPQLPLEQTRPFVCWSKHAIEPHSVVLSRLRGGRSVQATQLQHHHLNLFNVEWRVCSNSASWGSQKDSMANCS
jgi:hypothetical protein